MFTNLVDAIICSSIDTLRLRHRCCCVNRDAELASATIVASPPYCATHVKGLRLLWRPRAGRTWPYVTVTGAVVVTSCNLCAAIACVTLLQTARHTAMIDGAASFRIVMLHGGCNLLYINSHTQHSQTNMRASITKHENLSITLEINTFVVFYVFEMLLWCVTFCKSNIPIRRFVNDHLINGSKRFENIA